MTALQNIIKEAKILRAKYPKKYSKWTDYVKEASVKFKSVNKVGVIKKTVINKKYTHFALDTKTNKIVNAWNYTKIDKEDIRDYLRMDFRDNDYDPKRVKVYTVSYFKKIKIDPFNSKNWSNYNSSLSGYIKTQKTDNLTNVIYSKIEKKKAIPKKTIPKKVAIKKIAVKKQGVLFGVKKLHKDTKSHNVNIKVVSGISKNYKIGSIKTNVIDKLKIEIHRLKVIENELQQLQKMKIDPKFKEIKGTLILEERIVKNVIKEQKQHIKELKKII